MKSTHSSLEKNSSIQLEVPVVKREKQIFLPENLKKFSISKSLEETRQKIDDDLLRFRTCCADPRASK